MRARLKTEQEVRTGFMGLFKAAHPDGILIKLSTLGRYGTSGWPDYLVLLRRRALFVELKSELRGEKLTPLQERRHEALRRLGFPVATFSDARKAVAWIGAQA